MIYLIRGGHFAETVQRLKTLKPDMLIEALVPDFRGDPSCVEKVATSGLHVLHTILKRWKSFKEMSRPPCKFQAINGCSENGEGDSVMLHLVDGWSSYKAGEFYIKAMIEDDRAKSGVVAESSS
ncbi:hypothetical protein ZWY2020_008428 [Hordeum vulgare]|nr:hypothetical protein ZWY2020_008428 [Hordeum vulgare]